MSLIRPVIRMCAVAALSGRTLAEDRIYDTDNTPLIDALADDAKPFITVFTDDDNRMEFGGRDFYSSTRNLSLVLELGIATAISTEMNGKEIKIPATDEGMEAAVDVLESQALGALLGDPYNPWAELLHRIVMRVIRINSPRSGAANQSARWAARQIAIVCDVISDPPPGTVLPTGHPVRDFIALAEQSSPMMTAALLIDRLLNASPNPDWRQVQSWLGLTKQGIRSIGLAPVPPEDEEAEQLIVVSPVQEEWPVPSPSSSEDEFD